jgi:hypothetical protein
MSDVRVAIDRIIDGQKYEAEIILAFLLTDVQMNCIRDCLDPNTGRYRGAPIYLKLIDYDYSKLQFKIKYDIIYLYMEW